MFEKPLQQVASDGQASHHNAHHAHQFDEDVQRRAAGVLERVADGVANHCSLVVLRTFAAEVAFLDILLGIVPSTARVGHENGQDEARGRR